MSARSLWIARNAALALLAMAFFGNLYEAVVFIPFLASLPPGTLQIALGLGSPPLYFLPPGAILLVLLCTIAWRMRADPATARPALLAAGCFAVALASTAVAVLLVLAPEFAEETGTASAGAVLAWELLNALRLVLYVVAARALLLISRNARAVPA